LLLIARGSIPSSGSIEAVLKIIGSAKFLRVKKAQLCGRQFQIMMN
jgi:hypothetical protein